MSDTSNDVGRQMTPDELEAAGYPRDFHDLSPEEKARVEEERATAPDTSAHVPEPHETDDVRVAAERERLDSLPEGAVVEQQGGVAGGPNPDLDGVGSANEPDPALNEPQGPASDLEEREAKWNEDAAKSAAPVEVPEQRNGSDLSELRELAGVDEGVHNSDINTAGTRATPEQTEDIQAIRDAIVPGTSGPGDGITPVTAPTVDGEVVGEAYDGSGQGNAEKELEDVADDLYFDRLAARLAHAQEDEHGLWHVIGTSRSAREIVYDRATFNGRFEKVIGLTTGQITTASGTVDRA